jgi:hypothetical protein
MSSFFLETLHQFINTDHHLREIINFTNLMGENGFFPHPIMPNIPS